MKIHTLAQRIALGYALMVLVLAVTVTLTIVEVRELDRATTWLMEMREPTSKAGLELESGLNLAASALRGWIIAADERFKLERKIAWTQEIKAPLQQLESLSPHWATENIVRLNELKPLIQALEVHQQQVEELVLEDRTQANQLLESQAMPLVTQIRGILSAMLSAQSESFHQDFIKVSERIDFLGKLEWMLLAAGLLFATLLSLFITRAVTRPVADAVTVADNIAGGNLDTQVKVGGSRELDTLGAALINMRDSLLAKTRENARFNWLSNGQNQLNEVMRGDKTVEELATNIITFMASYTGANIGSLYLADDDHRELIFVGAYAVSQADLPSRFKLGEGLVGQVAASAKPYLLPQVEKDYIRVRSSLVDAAPRHIYLCPFSSEGSTLGVVELGKFESFDEVQQEFIQSSMEAVGIALNSASARNKIQLLLEETQQQSEELQQQQEELEQSNEELEEQTQQLKQQQEELQTVNEELEEQTQLIVQKNQDLEAVRESLELKARQLEVSSKYKSEFLANMSHELRTPLNSLLILANDLASNAKGNLDEEQVESAQVVSKSGHDLLYLINDILDLSKVEAGKLDLNISPIDISDFADDMMRNFRRTAQEKGLTMSCSVDPNLNEQIKTDRNRLEQVLNNLISNALKFTEKGEIRVDFLQDPGGLLAIAVSDSGIGIPADKHDTIFEAFVQIEGGTSRRYGGTGLGLSICRELAGLLGGSIKVESELGKGSTFTLMLPLEVVAKGVETQGPARQILPRKQVLEFDKSRFLDFPSIADQRHEIDKQDQVVLIIEDDDNFAHVLARQAVEKGFKHLNAATGEDGLRLAAEFLPHAIVLDLDLPGIDGHMVLKELKSNPDLRHIPVHIMSVDEKTLDPIRCGAVDYLTKPVSKAQLDGAFARMEDFVKRKIKTLLIVEDDDNMRKAIVKLIGNGDVSCLQASNATEALEIIRQHQIDCMVLDVGLPDISGFELIRQLEKEHKGKMPPIIVYTGRELSRQENDELQQYAETIIVKGVKSEERLLDETALFLHRTVKNLPESKRELIARMYDGAAQFKGKRILLVDDDMRNVFALSKLLKDRGMEILKAENGATALEVLASNPDLDFVLMDIMMPEMDGYECMQRIRKQREFRDLPIVALTAKAMKEDRQKCISAGANDYIAKPVDVDRLISLMRIWIRK